MSKRKDSDHIQRHWEHLFKIAADAFPTRGRGVVFVRNWFQEFVYLCAVEASEKFDDPNFIDTLESYDPLQHVIVVVRHETSEGVDSFARYELKREDYSSPGATAEESEVEA